MSFELKLVEVMERKQLVAVYTDASDWNSFNLGYVKFVQDDFFCLKAITPFGEDDGYMFHKVEDVQKIDVQTPYAQSIEVLMQNRGAVFEEVDIRATEELDALEAILSVAQDNNLVVRLWSENDGETPVVGYVSDYTEETITIAALTDEGAPAGLETVGYDDVGAVEVNSRRNQTRDFLANHKGVGRKN